MLRKLRLDRPEVQHSSVGSGPCCGLPAPLLLAWTWGRAEKSTESLLQTGNGLHGPQARAQ